MVASGRSDEHPYRRSGQGKNPVFFQYFTHALVSFSLSGGRFARVWLTSVAVCVSNNGKPPASMLVASARCASASDLASARKY